MFEISDLKAKKLPELQEIAKGFKCPKYKTLKKLDLVTKSLTYRPANPKAVQETAYSASAAEKQGPIHGNQELPRER